MKETTTPEDVECGSKTCPTYQAVATDVSGTFNKKIWCRKIIVSCTGFRGYMAHSNEGFAKDEKSELDGNFNLLIDQFANEQLKCPRLKMTKNTKKEV